MRTSIGIIMGCAVAVAAVGGPMASHAAPQPVRNVAAVVPAQPPAPAEATSASRQFVRTEAAPAQARVGRPGPAGLKKEKPGNPGAPAGTYAVDVAGTWVSPGGECHPADTSNLFHVQCTGTAVALGDWNGGWIEHIDGYVSTSGLKGKARQCFSGKAYDGTSGTLFVDETFSTNSANTLQGYGKILGGAGEWAGSSGTYHAEGYNPAVGLGGWDAHWIRPKKAPAADPLIGLTSPGCAVPAAASASNAAPSALSVSKLLGVPISRP